MMIRYKSVVTTMTINSSMHENVNRSIYIMYKKKFQSTSNILYQNVSVLVKDNSLNQKYEFL